MTATFPLFPLFLFQQKMDQDAISQANNFIKDLESIYLKDNQSFSEIAMLVAFFHNLSSYMSMELIKSKKKNQHAMRSASLLFWLDIPAELSQTKNLYNVVNQYFKFLSFFVDEFFLDDTKRLMQKAHIYFDQCLSSNYSNLQRKNYFGEIPTFCFKNQSSDGSLIDNNRNLRDIRNKILSCFNFKNINYMTNSQIKAPAKAKSKGQKGAKITSNPSLNLDVKLFLPSMKEIAFLQKTVFVTKDMNTANTDFIRTYKELINLYLDEKNCEINIKDFIFNPRLDIIRENPLFQKYLYKISLFLPELLTSFITLNNRLTEIFTRISRLDKRLSNSFALPQIDFDSLRETTIEESKCSAELHKLKFMKQVFDEYSENIPNNQNLSLDIIMQIHQKYNNLNAFIQQNHNNADSVDAIKKEIEGLAKWMKDNDIEKKVSQQVSEQISVKRKLEEGIRRISTSKRATQLPSNIEQTIIDLRNRTSKLSSQYIKKRTEANEMLIESIGKHIALCSDIKLKPLFPFQIEKMIHTLSDQAAEFQWLNIRKEIQSQSNSQQAEINKKLQSNLTALKSLIEMKKKDIETLKSQKSSSPSNNLSELGLCPICRKRQRSLVITSCGHSFCDVCLDEEKHCPICNQKVSSNNTIPIRWK